MHEHLEWAREVEWCAKVRGHSSVACANNIAEDAQEVRRVHSEDRRLELKLVRKLASYYEREWRVGVSLGGIAKWLRDCLGLELAILSGGRVICSELAASPYLGLTHAGHF